MLDFADSERFADLSVREIYATPLDEGTYVGSSTSEDADWIAPAGRRMIVQVNSTHTFGDEKSARSVGPRVRELGDHDRKAYESDRKQHWRKVESLPRTGSRGNTAHTLRTPVGRPQMSRDHVDALRPADSPPICLARSNCGVVFRTCSRCANQMAQQFGGKRAPTRLEHLPVASKSEARSKDTRRDFEHGVESAIPREMHRDRIDELCASCSREATR
jgi:hypothetical protein